MRGARPWVILPDYLLGGLVPARGLRRAVRLLFVGTASTPSDPRVTPADHFGPSFAVAQLLVVVQEVRQVSEPEPTPPLSCY